MADGHLKQLAEALTAAVAAMPDPERIPSEVGRLPKPPPIGSKIFAELASLVEKSSQLSDLIGMHQCGFSEETIPPINVAILTGSLFWRTIFTGSSDKAISELIQLAKANRGHSRLLAAVVGVKVERLIHLAPGLSISPFQDEMWPAWRKKDSAYIQAAPPELFGTMSPSSVIVYEREYSPVFGSEVQSRIKFPQEDMSHLEIVLSCISLISNRPSAIVKAWWESCDDRLPLKAHATAYTSLAWQTGATSEPSAPLDQADAQKLAGQYLAFLGKSDPLDIAIDRLNRSRRGSLYNDRAIDLGIAIEAILMYEARSDNQEISHKISIRGAWLLGRNFIERQKIASDIKKIYQKRSQAVHGGRVRNATDWDEPRRALDAGAALVTRLIRAILERGRWPDWDSLVLGGGG